MNSTNLLNQSPNNPTLEQVEIQLRQITNSLEQLGLDAVQKERLIALTFIDILNELDTAPLHNGHQH
ncbi:MAG TPA: hypothetical protein DD379_22225 [Cyanobacteria bacterium UBA11162]|nr:hypothetical protein [Cyanobacteria bacterium UBA11162]